MGSISYSIISRGAMIIKYSDNIGSISIRVTGELIFNPPTFYADLKSIKERTSINEDIRTEIVQYIESDSEKRIGTKIIFD